MRFGDPGGDDDVRHRVAEHLRDRLALQPSGSDQMPGRYEERPISTAVLFFEEKEN